MRMLVPWLPRKPRLPDDLLCVELDVERGSVKYS